MDVINYELQQDGNSICTNTDLNALLMSLQRLQSQSANWAIKYEGWRVIEHYSDGTNKDISKELTK